MNKLRVDFFCIGAHKAGTTSLHDTLKQHPEIFLPKNKECHFFDVEERYSQGLDFFATFFEGWDKFKFIGNINPNLDLNLKSLERVKIHFPNSKIIYVLRNPIERAYSHFLMSKFRGYEKLKFEDALKDESNRLSNPKKHSSYYTSEPNHFEKNHFGYRYRSIYSRNIRFLLQNFNSESLMFIDYDVYKSNPHKIISEILNFIGASEIKLELKRSNTGKVPKSKLLSNILNNNDRAVFSVLKKNISKNLKIKIKNTLNDLNSKKPNKPSSILLDELQKKYFEHEIFEIQKLLNQKSLWR